MYSSGSTGSTIRRVTEDTPVQIGAPEGLPGASAVSDAAERRERLKTVYREARACSRCAQLVSARTQVVFGSGHANADLMFVGASPSVTEDEIGSPFIGAPGRLLDDLLGGIGLARGDVFVTHALKCRPPGNRDADPAELARCRSYLDAQIALVRPRVVCTLGNFATRAVRGSGSVSELHGRAEAVELGGRAVYLVPLLHPVAALYTQSMLGTLRADVAGLPEILARPELPQPVDPGVVEGPEEGLA